MKFAFGTKRVEPVPVVTPVTTPPSALAMRLALAHYVERCIEDGTLASYADAAQRLGITRARMTQVMDLLLLSAQQQLHFLKAATNAQSQVVA